MSCLLGETATTELDVDERVFLLSLFLGFNRLDRVFFKREFPGETQSPLT